VLGAHAGLSSVQQGSPLWPHRTHLFPEHSDPGWQSSGGSKSQQNWSTMPQGWQVPPTHTVFIPQKLVGGQQGCIGPPQGTHMPSSWQTEPGKHCGPIVQQGCPGLPHGEGPPRAAPGTISRRMVPVTTLNQAALRWRARTLRAIPRVPPTQSTKNVDHNVKRPKQTGLEQCSFVIGYFGSLGATIGPSSRAALAVAAAACAAMGAPTRSPYHGPVRTART
jgi:hypothetical protein